MDITRRIRIGLLGASWVAPHAVIDPAKSFPKIAVRAVAARDPQRAALFAKQHNIPKVHETYEEVLKDPEIDAVYIGLPNSHHHEWTLKAIAAGKHVLCEKPMTNTAMEAQEIEHATARSGKLVVMEAFHYRYHALTQRLMQLINEGCIGKVSRVEAIVRLPVFLKSDIRFNYNLGGGALMDCGCYAVNIIRQCLFAQRRFQQGKLPRPALWRDEKKADELQDVEDDEQLHVISADTDLMSPNVDSTTRAELRTREGLTASLECSIRTLIPQVSLSVFGEGTGRIDVTNWIFPQTLYNKMTITDTKGKSTTEKFTGDTTYLAQLKVFAECIETGTRPPSDTRDAVKNMRVIDDIYKKINLPLRGSHLKIFQGDAIKPDLSSQSSVYKGEVAKPTLQSDPLKPSFQSDPLKPPFKSDMPMPPHQSDPLKPPYQSDSLKPSFQSDSLKTSFQSDSLKPSFQSDSLKTSSFQSDSLKPTLQSDPLKPPFKTDPLKPPFQSEPLKPVNQFDRMGVQSDKMGYQSEVIKPGYEYQSDRPVLVKREIQVETVKPVLINPGFQGEPNKPPFQTDVVKPRADARWGMP